MQPSRNIVAAAGLIFSLAGCTVGQAFSGSIDSVPSQKIDVVRAVAHNRRGVIQLDGDVRRPDGFTGMVRGHLEIEGRNEVGQIVARTQARWADFISRRLGRAYFRAFLVIPPGQLIKAIKIQPVIEAPT